MSSGDVFPPEDGSTINKASRTMVDEQKLFIFAVDLLVTMCDEYHFLMIAIQSTILDVSLWINCLAVEYMVG